MLVGINVYINGGMLNVYEAETLPLLQDEERAQSAFFSQGGGRPFPLCLPR